MMHIAQHHTQILNAVLRLIPMGAKLLLTLYMGKFFSLSEIGDYGLVSGAVVILTVLVGQDLIYFVSRDIVGSSQTTVLQKVRDQVIVYCINYCILGLIFAGLLYTQSTHISPHILIYTFILTILESLGSIAYYNINALQHQVRANILFFIRAGLWVFPVMFLCFVSTEYRTADTVLLAWIFGATTSLLATAFWWRKLPWHDIVTTPVNMTWIKHGFKTSLPIWCGTIGLTAGTFIDRFVVQHYLTIDDVGVLTFYFSFTNALLTLMQSGVSSFSVPRLIQHHINGDTENFNSEARKAHKQTAISAGAIAIILGVAIPWIGTYLGHHAFNDYRHVLWLMLVGTWLRANADMLNSILYARHQDSAVWVGNLLFLIPALGGNLFFVPHFGLIGIGYSGILASIFLLIWRAWKVRTHHAH